MAAFTVGFVAPAVSVGPRARAGAPSRNLVVLDLTGGNDGLSMLVPYTDGVYYSRRPTLAIPAGQVLQIGSDSSGKPLGLHPKLTGLRDIFNQGRLALIQRAGYENSSRSHFSGTDIWSTANPASSKGPGWVGRYLSTLAPPLDPLVAWNTTGDTPHALLSSSVAVASIPSVSGYAFRARTPAAMPRSSARRPPASRRTCRSIGLTSRSSAGPCRRPWRRSTAWRRSVSTSRAWPIRHNGFGQALQAWPAPWPRNIGTKVFWVQTGGFDTHAGQDTNSDNGAYVKLMVSLNDGLTAFYTDLKDRGS